MIHPDTELQFICPEKGYGVVAIKPIPKGTVTWVLDPLDRVFTDEDIKPMPQVIKKLLDTYTFRDNCGRSILCWDHGRYVNHSFRPSCITTAYDFEIAVRNIEPGEELTNDYGTLNITQPFHCLPEKGIRRKVVYPDDLLKYYRKWDKEVFNALKRFNQVQQPLLQFISKNTLTKVVDIIDEKYKMASIKTCYYRPCRPDRKNRTKYSLNIFQNEPYRDIQSQST